LSLRAVIFDYGMVLSAPADPASHEELIRIFGAPAAAFEEQYWAHRHAYDAGAHTGESFWNTCAAGAGITLSPEQIALLIENDIRMWSSIDQTMVDWAMALGRAGIRIGVLSNIGFELVPALKQTHPFLANFHHCTWSCDLRLAKPDPAIYLHTLEQLGVAPEEALFLDDRVENVNAARSLGIDAILFKNPAQLHQELATRGLDALLPPVLSEAEAR
jgi:putative hydrolase of the HAD superfamily